MPSKPAQRQALLRLARLIPRNLLDYLIESGGRDATEYGYNGEAAVLFADVSGFTALSERLAKLGRIGAEEITRLLNRFFGEMIGVVEERGGVLTKFSGDAMTVLFFPDGEANIAERASSAALEILRRMSDYTSLETAAGEVHLKLKIAATLGEVTCGVVGNAEHGESYFVAGEGIDLLGAAEELAESGELIVTSAVLERLGNSAKSEPRGAIHHLLRELAFDKVKGVTPLALAELSDKKAEELERAILPLINQNLRQRFGQSTRVAEHRRVVVLFVNFTHQDYSKADSRRRLDDFFQSVTKQVNRFDGWINKIDIGDKGSTMLIFWGAPVAHEDDLIRALNCARVLASDKLGSYGILCERIGITAGVAFAGEVGSETMQEYTVIGKTVNLAARLMSIAERNQQLCSELVRERAEKNFSFRFEGERQLKGLPAPVPLYSLLGRRRSFNETVRVVGRDEELDQLEKALGALAFTGGRVVRIIGPAGFGKTYLLTGLSQRVSLERQSWLYGVVTEVEGKTPLSLWHDLFVRLLKLKEEQSAEEMKKQLAAGLAELTDDPELLRRLPFLGAMVFSLDYPDSIYEAVDAKLRAENLIYLVTHLLRQVARRRPTIFIFDDLHWADGLSLRMIADLARYCETEPFLCLCVQRPREEELLTFDEAVPVEVMSLETLSKKSTHQLIEKHLDDESCSEELLELLWQKTQGNPFFVEELTRHLRDSDQLVRLDNHWDAADTLDAMELPGTMESAVMARLDLLEEELRHLMKRASVVGQNFEGALLTKLNEGESLTRLLDELVELEMLFNFTARELDYSFRHAVTRDVAYNSLPFQLRRELHERLARILEKLPEERLRPRLGLVAYHLEMAELSVEAANWYHRAGEAASEDFRNQEALEFLAKSITLTDDNRLKVKALLERIKLYELAGRFEEAEDDFKTLEEGVNLTDEERIVRGYKYANFLVDFRRKFDDSERVAKETLELSREKSSRKGEAESLWVLGLVHRYRGQFDEAIALWNQQIEIAREIGDELLESFAYGAMGIILGAKGEIDASADYHMKHLLLSENLGNQRGIGIANTNLAIAHAIRNQLPEALERFQRAHDIHQKTGDRLNQARTIGNMGHLNQVMGNLALTLKNYKQEIEIYRDTGTENLSGGSLGRLGMFQVSVGHYEEGIPNVTQALTILEKNGSEQHQLWGKMFYARMLLDVGRFTEFTKLMKIADAKIEELHDVTSMEQSRMWRILILMEFERYEEACEIAKEAAELYQEHEQFEEQADILTLWGTILIRQGKLTEAKELLLRANTTIGKSAPMFLYPNLMALFEVHVKLGETDKAAEALAVVKTLGDLPQFFRSDILECDLRLALAREEWDEATSLTEELLARLKTNGYPQEIKHRRELVHALLLLNRSKEAEEQLSAAKTVADKLGVPLTI